MEKILLDHDVLYYWYVDKNLTQEEVAKQLNVGITTVYLNLRSHKIKKTKIQILETKKQTWLRTRGVDHPMKDPAVQEKAKASWVANLGVDNPSKSQEVKNKKELTSLRERGVRHTLQDPAVRAAGKETLIKNLGVDHPMKAPKVQEKAKASWQANWGVDHPMKNKEFREKRTQQFKDSWGVDHPMKSSTSKERQKQTCQEKWGTDNPFQVEEFKNKTKQTCLDILGVDNPSKSSVVKQKKKQTCIESLGVDNPSKSADVRQKVIAKLPQSRLRSYSTKKKNNSFHRSKPEDEILAWLCEVYGEYGIERHYRTAEYPFACDYYVNRLNLYIEYQGSWTHGTEPFNDIDTQHQVIKDKWSQKQTAYYENALHNWVVRDTNKRECAFKSNLNFLEIWSGDYNKGREHIQWLVSKEQLPLKFSDTLLAKEFAKINELTGEFSTYSRYNKIVQHYQPHFYRRERQLWNNPYIRDSLLANREKYLNKSYLDLTNAELLRGFKISGVYKGFTYFNPLLIKAFISRYSVTSIYDPCAGWGHRLLGVASCGIPYTGTDSWPETVVGLRTIIRTFNLLNCRVYQANAADFVPDIHDAVFSCPPYFNTEKYLGEASSTLLHPEYNSWLHVWWRQVVRQCRLTNARIYGFVFSANYIKDIVAVCEEEGLFLVETIPLDNRKDHFNQSNKKSTEHLLVFRK